MEVKGLIKYTALSFLIGILPLVIVFAIYFYDKESSILSVLFEMANGYNRDFSEQHLTVSTIASTYTKTAPFFVILMYALCWNKFESKAINLDIKKWFKILPGTIILIVGIYWLTYVGIDNMSDSMYRVKRVIAENEYLLMIYYILLFLTNYFFIWLFVLYLYALKGLPYFKKRV
ncbi:hypothetical protein ACYK0L_002780 [Enterobacter hormaechei]